MGFNQQNGGLMGFTLWLCQQFANLKMAHRNSFRFPINSMVIFHSHVNVYQRVTILKNHGVRQWEG